MAFDEKWLNDFIAKGGKVTDSMTGKQITAQIGGKRNKYGNEKTQSNGKRFDSKHEAQVYEQLRLRCLSGEFIALACQVAFYLPGGVKYLADFVTIGKDMSVVVYDAKSEATRKDKTYRLKRRLMEACHNIKIQEV